jgi:hypothetical protein
MAVSIISTAQPSFRTTGLITLTSAQAYDAASPTATKPSTTSQSALLYDIGTNYPSLLRLTPITSANNFTSVGMRVVGWNSYLQTAGTKVWIPTVLADVTLGYTSGTVASLTIDTVSTFFFSSATIGSGVPTVNAYSPATAATGNVQPASVIVDAVGSQLITLQFKATGTTPKMGAFWATI